MKKYIWIFSAAYFVLLLGLGFLADLFNFKAAPISFGMSALLGAGFAGGWQFNKDNNRLPTKKEKWTFAWLGLLCSWLIALLMFFVAFAILFSDEPLKMAMLLNLFNESKILNMVFILLGIAFISIFQILIIFFSFSWYTKISFNRT